MHDEKWKATEGIIIDDTGHKEDYEEELAAGQKLKVRGK